MADSVTTQKIVDGPVLAVLKFTNKSDGTGEFNSIKVDVSTLAGIPPWVRIYQCWYTTDGMGVNILFEANTNTLALTIPPNSTGHLDFRYFGGIGNDAGVGRTGNILFTTVGHAVNDGYSIILEVKKN